MHSVEWMWVIMVPAFVVPHVDWDWRVKCGEEVVRTCERREESKGHKPNIMKFFAITIMNYKDDTFLEAALKQTHIM